MSPLDPTSNQEQGAVDEALLAAAAFGTLAPDEERDLQDLLARSPAARAELASLRELAGGLALLAEERSPSPALRNRLAAAIATGPAPAADPAPAAPTPLRPGPALSWIPSSWWLAAAAVLVAALVGGVLLDRFVLGGDEAGPDTIAYELTTPIPNLSAELTYDPDDQLFVLSTENMPPAPAEHVYQVWLIDKEGVPQPSGVMEGSTFAVAANREAFDAFAITVEPAPLGSAAPTTEPFLVAPLTEPAAD